MTRRRGVAGIRVVLESHASAADTIVCRSDFPTVIPGFAFVSANFGIAMAARMPTMTTTIGSSMRVKPRRVRFGRDRWSSPTGRAARCLAEISRAVCWTH
jgi:hypothetical protein